MLWEMTRLWPTCPFRGKVKWKSVKSYSDHIYTMKHFYPHGYGVILADLPPSSGHDGATEWFDETENES